MSNFNLFNKLRFLEQSARGSCESINKMIVHKQRKCLEEFVLNCNECSSAVTKTSIMITFGHPRGLRIQGCAYRTVSTIVTPSLFMDALFVFFLLVANAISPI